MRRLVLLVAGVVAVTLPTAAAASPPTPVTITVLADFSGPVPQGTFTATSPLCASGTDVLPAGVDRLGRLFL